MVAFLIAFKVRTLIRQGDFSKGYKITGNVENKLLFEDHYPYLSGLKRILNMKHIRLIFFCMLANALSVSAQDVIHHYETIIRAENSWRYFVGQSAPPSDWMTNEFNDAAWPIGPGGFGYAASLNSLVIQSEGGALWPTKYRQLFSARIMVS